MWWKQVLLPPTLINSKRIRGSGAAALTLLVGKEVQGDDFHGVIPARFLNCSRSLCLKNDVRAEGERGWRCRRCVTEIGKRFF